MKNQRHHSHSSIALLASVLLLSGNALQAQVLRSAPAARDGARTFSSITGSITGKSELESGNTGFGEVSSKEFTAEFRETLPLSAGSDLALGLNYGRTSFEVASGGPVSPIPRRLQSLALDVSYAQRFNDSWSAELAVSPGYHSAGSLFNSRSFGATAELVGAYRINARLSVGAGANFDSLAAGEKFRGIFAADWTPSNQWRVRFGFPRTAVTYVFSDALEFTGFVTGTFASYSVQDDPQPGLNGKPSLDRTKLDYDDTRAGLAVTYKFTRQLSVSATVGRLLERQFDYHQRNFKLRADDGAAYGALGLTCHF